MAKKRNRHWQHQKSKKGSPKINQGRGIPCPRCSQPTVKWAWQNITDRVSKTKSFAYKFWFECQNTRCQTQLIMPKEPSAVVHYREPEPEKAPAEPDLQSEHAANLAHFRSI